MSYSRSSCLGDVFVGWVWIFPFYLGYWQGVRFLTLLTFRASVVLSLPVVPICFLQVSVIRLSWLGGVADPTVMVSD